MLKIDSGKKVKNFILVRMNSQRISQSTEKLQARLISGKSKEVQMRILWKTLMFLALSLELRENIHTGAYLILDTFVLCHTGLWKKQKERPVFFYFFKLFYFLLIILFYSFALPGSKTDIPLQIKGHKK